MHKCSYCCFQLLSIDMYCQSPMSHTEHRVVMPDCPIFVLLGDFWRDKFITDTGPLITIEGALSNSSLELLPVSRSCNKRLRPDAVTRHINYGYL